MFVWAFGCLHCKQLCAFVKLHVSVKVDVSVKVHVSVQVYMFAQVLPSSQFSIQSLVGAPGSARASLTKLYRFVTEYMLMCAYVYVLCVCVFFCMSIYIVCVYVCNIYVSVCARAYVRCAYVSLS